MIMAFTYHVCAIAQAEDGRTACFEDDVSLNNNTNSYLLFAGDDYYPVGGARDFIGIFESMEKAIEKHNPSIYRDQGWANIFSLKSLQIVKKFYHGEWYLPDDEI